MHGGACRSRAKDATAPPSVSIRPGVYTIAADARRGSEMLGTASRPVLVGGADVELSEPRLNEEVLRRIADAPAAGTCTAADAASLPALLQRTRHRQPADRDARSLAHGMEPGLLIVALLGAEWLVAPRGVGLA